MTFWQIIAWITLVGQIALLILAIRLYLVQRARTFVFLMWACICFVIATTGWFTFGFLGGFITGQQDAVTRAAAYRWSQYTEHTFRLFFVVLMILALISFIRERSPGGRPRV